MKLPTILELLQSGVHFGHQKGRWHPKMKEFIFTEKNGVHVIDLEQTVLKLEAATKFVSGVAQKGGVILFVGTKRQGQGLIEKYAKEANMPYINERWIGGLFTNFANVSKLIKKYRDLTEKVAAGLLDKYTKKEQSEFAKEIEKLRKSVGGLTELKKLPDALIILDAKKEKTAIMEAEQKKVPIVGFCDSNINPDMLTYPIPANDDAVKSIDIILKTLAAAINEGRAKQNEKAEA